MRLCLIGKNPEYVLAYRGSLIRAAQARGHEVVALTAASSIGADPMRRRARALAHSAAQSPAQDAGIAGAVEHGFDAAEASEHLDASTRLARARKRLTDAGVTLHTVPLDGGSTNPLRDLNTLRRMTRALREIAPDAVFCYNPKPLAYGPVAARRAGVRRVAAMVTGLGYAFTGTGAKRAVIRSIAVRLYRRSLGACDVVFFQNRDDLALFTRLGIVFPTPARQAAPSRGPRIVTVAGSGVDLERFAQEPLPAAPIVRFVMIARLLRDKGAFEFVDAARIAHRELPDATFALVGGIDDNPTAVPGDELARWRREGLVELPGEVDDVRAPLRSATVFVLPSHREGTSKVMLEAMATGRAIITTDAVGCREPVERGVNGLLVPVGDARALAAAMIELARDRARVERMGAESRRIAEARYDAKRVDATILGALGL